MAMNLDAYQRAMGHRNLLSELFIVLLVGLAYQEMVAPVRESFRTDGLTWETIALVLIFILTTLRFFFGGLLHLVHEDLLKMDGRVWFTDFAVIALEMLILIFLGGVTSLDATVHARIGFIDYLIFLLAIDILWVVVIQWLCGKMFTAWKRPVLWKWAQLNLTLGLILLLIRTLMPDPYGSLALTIITIVNVVVFALDVFWADYYVLIRKSST